MLWLSRKRSEPYLINRVAQWSLNNGMSGEVCIMDMEKQEAFDYVARHLMIEGKADRHGLDWLEIEIVEYWSN